MRALLLQIVPRPCVAVYMHCLGPKDIHVYLALYYLVYLGIKATILDCALSTSPTGVEPWCKLKSLDFQRWSTTQFSETNFP